MELKSIHIMAIYLVAEMFSYVFLMPYFLSLGFNNKSVLTFFLIAYISAAASIALGNKSDPKKSIIIAMSLRIATSLYIFLSGTALNASIVGLLSGLMFFFFWVPLNYSYLLTISGGRASESWKYSFTPIIIGIIIPLIAGLVSSRYGLRFMFIFGILFYVLGILATLNFKGQPVNYKLKDCLGKYSKLRTLTFIEGFWQPAIFIGIPLVTASYLSSGLKFGMFYSYLGIASALAALFIARYSDKNNERKIFIYILSFAMSIVTILSAFHSSFSQWKIIAGLLYFLHPMAVTFFLTMFLDLKKHEIIPECIIAREYLLNLGRALGTIVLLIFSFYGNFVYGYAVLGISMLIYPFLVKLKRIYLVEGYNVQD